jgi:glycerol 3-phosphatase-2
MGLGQGAWSHHLSTGSEVIRDQGAEWAFREYESVRHRLPAVRRQAEFVRADNLDAIAEQFDVFLLDAFGVLNIGETAIPGVVDRVNRLRERGKQVMVVTNAAGYPSSVLHARYQRLGYSFGTDDVVSSRMALLRGLENPSGTEMGHGGAAEIRPR